MSCMTLMELLKGIAIVTAVIYGLGFAVSVFLISTSPEGYEDEDGFHRL